EVAGDLRGVAVAGGEDTGEGLVDPGALGGGEAGGEGVGDLVVGGGPALVPQADQPRRRQGVEIGEGVLRGDVAGPGEKPCRRLPAEEGEAEEQSARPGAKLRRPVGDGP